MSIFLNVLCAVRSKHVSDDIYYQKTQPINNVVGAVVRNFLTSIYNSALARTLSYNTSNSAAQALSLFYPNIIIG